MPLGQSFVVVLAGQAFGREGRPAPSALPVEQKLDKHQAGKEVVSDSRRQAVRVQLVPYNLKVGEQRFVRTLFPRETTFVVAEELAGHKRPPTQRPRRLRLEINAMSRVEP